MEQKITSTKLRELRNVKREKRAVSLAEQGLVDRIGDRFRVSVPGINSRSLSYEVIRDETGQVCCTCLEFLEKESDGGFVCEHIMAVKFAIRLKNTEPALKEATEKEAETESRLSPRGEQKLNISGTDALSAGQAEAKWAGEKKLRNTKGEKEMKRSKPSELPLAADTKGGASSEAQNNILNFSSTLRELRKTLDPQLVKHRESDRGGQSQMIDYVEWHTVADILDSEAPSWTHSVKDIRAIGEIVTVTVAITIDGITREGVGTGSAASEMGIKKAEHDALKRAAVKFGIARDLYKKEFEAGEQDVAVAALTRAEEPVGFPANPIARSLSDLVTAKQLGMIRALAREMSIDADKESNSLMRCRIDEMSKRAASALIQHLQDMQKGKGTPAVMPRAA